MHFYLAPCGVAAAELCAMLGLWSAGGEYAIQAIFALTAVAGLVVILAMFWFWSPVG